MTSRNSNSRTPPAAQGPAASVFATPSGAAGHHIISKAAAKKLGLVRYFTGKPCCRGHVCERHVSGGCVACSREASRRFRLKNPERRRESRRRYYLRNIVMIRQIHKLYRWQNPEKEKERRRRSDLRNQDKVRRRKRMQALKNPEKKLEKNKQRNQRIALALEIVKLLGIKL